MSWEGKERKNGKEGKRKKEDQLIKTGETCSGRQGKEKQVERVKVETQ